MFLVCTIYVGVRSALLGGLGGYRSSAGSSLLFDGDLWKASSTQIFYLLKNILFSVDETILEKNPYYYLFSVQVIIAVYSFVKFKKERLDSFWIMIAILAILPTLVIQKHGNISGVGGRLAYFPMVGICMILSTYLSCLNNYIICIYVFLHLFILNINISIWETASENMRTSIARIQRIPGDTGYYFMPDFLRGAALGVNVHPALGRLYAPALTLHRLLDVRECVAHPGASCPPALETGPAAPALKLHNLWSPPRPAAVPRP